MGAEWDCERTFKNTVSTVLGGLPNLGATFSQRYPSLD